MFLQALGWSVAACLPAWVWIWVLSWTKASSVPPAGNQSWALRAWLEHPTCQIHALSLGFGLPIGICVEIDRFVKTCWKSAWGSKALGLAFDFSNLAPKPYVWVWVWCLTWIKAGFTRLVGNLQCASRPWPGP